MTGKTDAAAVAINNARALLGTLLASSFQDMHVVSGDMEIFLARPAGGANPMRGQAAPAPTEAAPLGKDTLIKAPHVATLFTTAALGDRVSAGQEIATLSVLDEQFPLLAAIAGTIVGIKSAVGSLIEFDQPLLLLRQIE